MLASAVFFSHRKWLRKKQQHQSKAVAEISPIPVSVAFFLLGRVFSANANSRVDMMVSLHTNSCAFAQIPWTDCLLAKVCMQSIVVHYKTGIACSNATTICLFQSEYTNTVFTTTFLLFAITYAALSKPNLCRKERQHAVAFDSSISPLEISTCQIARVATDFTHCKLYEYNRPTETGQERHR